MKLSKLSVKKLNKQLHRGIVLKVKNLILLLLSFLILSGSQCEEGPDAPWNQICQQCINTCDQTCLGASLYCHPNCLCERCPAACGYKCDTPGDRYPQDAGLLSSPRPDVAVMAAPDADITSHCSAIGTCQERIECELCCTEEALPTECAVWCYLALCRS